MSEPILLADGISGGYGGVDIIHDLHLRVDPGELVVIIGPNGAGKSTALKAVFGLVRLSAGAVRFAGRDITNMRTDRIVRQGLAYVPQERNIFPNLTIHENLEMGAYIRDDDISGRLEEVYALFPALRERRREQAGLLSGGQRQMVAMGRALMLDPRMLLLDEPTAGLAPAYVDQIFERVTDINANGVAVLMVEQNARQALSIADRGYVMTNGSNNLEDTGPNLLADKAVAEAFLGGQGEG